MSEPAIETGQAGAPPPHRNAAGEVTRRKNRTLKAAQPPTAQDNNSGTPSRYNAFIDDLNGGRQDTGHDGLQMLPPDEQQRTFYRGIRAESIVQDDSGMQEAEVDEESDDDRAWKWRQHLTAHLPEQSRQNLSKLEESFLNAKNIDTEVLRQEMGRCVGREAYLRSHPKIRNGWRLYSVRPFAQWMLVELLKASSAFQKENNLREKLGFRKIPYVKSETRRQWEAVWQAAKHRPCASPYMAGSRNRFPPEQDSEPISMNDTTPYQSAGEMETALESSRSLVPTPGSYSDPRSGGGPDPAISLDIPQDFRNFAVNEAEVGNAPGHISLFDRNSHAANESVSLDVTASETATSNDPTSDVPQTPSDETSPVRSDQDDIVEVPAFHRADAAFDGGDITTRTRLKPMKTIKLGNKFRQLSNWHPLGRDNSREDQRRRRLHTAPFWSHELHKLPFRR